MLILDPSNNTETETSFIDSFKEYNYIYEHPTAIVFIKIIEDTIRLFVHENIENSLLKRQLENFIEFHLKKEYKKKEYNKKNPYMVAITDDHFFISFADSFSLYWNLHTFEVNRLISEYNYVKIVPVQNYVFMITQTKVLLLDLQTQKFQILGTIENLPINSENEVFCDIKVGNGTTIYPYLHPIFIKTSNNRFFTADTYNKTMTGTLEWKLLDQLDPSDKITKITISLFDSFILSENHALYSYIDGEMILDEPLVELLEEKSHGSDIKEMACTLEYLFIMTENGDLYSKRLRSLQNKTEEGLGLWNFIRSNVLSIKTADNGGYLLFITTC